MWVFGIVGMLALAVATAAVAERKGQDGLPWFLVGLLAPVLGLLIAVVVLRGDVRGPAGGDLPTATEAARASPVTRRLATDAGSGVDELAEATGLSERVVRDHLAALRTLGLAGPGGDGLWYLTSEGAGTNAGP